MRTARIVVCGMAGTVLLTGSTLFAQAPAGTQGAAPARRPSTIGGGTGARWMQAPAGPTRISPSLGSSVSGGIGLPGGGGGPQRRLRRNQTPTLSPYLRMDPAFNASFEGQYLTNILPQQEFNRTQQQTQQAFNRVQGEIGQQQLDIQSGLSTTGHKTTFMNLGSYYPGGQ